MSVLPIPCIYENTRAGSAVRWQCERAYFEIMQCTQKNAAGFIADLAWNWSSCCDSIRCSFLCKSVNHINNYFRQFVRRGIHACHVSYGNTPYQERLLIKAYQEHSLIKLVQIDDHDYDCKKCDLIDFESRPIHRLCTSPRVPSSFLCYLLPWNHIEGTLLPATFVSSANAHSTQSVIFWTYLYCDMKGNPVKWLVISFLMPLQ